MGFLRHLQPEKFIHLNQKLGACINITPIYFSSWQRYPLIGCSPAEPISVCLHNNNINRFNEKQRICY